ncbi:hypothetical protein D0C16_14780 [Cellvibrio sp. KY-GH-1]|uniref:hypothetical protein n=1 Tax=Cellvibrio sp. KY-GH-1 TaxID=2303332 RepID=UPI001244C666|nr:hypothetical protein [Cellvibrio sp. KY-GH-1]QEY17130.1 hypothetical protein D0C16_14780 [Cellvibrio sp. KY-GH-1]
MICPKVLKVIPMIVLMGLASCATRPDKIAATTLPQDKYQSHECSLLDSELKKAQSELAVATEKQNSAANTDAWLLILSIVPLSKVTGDYEKEVANWKGEVNAIETEKQKKKCA